MRHSAWHTLALSSRPFIPIVGASTWTRVSPCTWNQGAQNRNLLCTIPQHTMVLLSIITVWSWSEFKHYSMPVVCWSSCGEKLHGTLCGWWIVPRQRLLMGKHLLRLLSERSWISGMYVSGARPCGYELRVETSLAAVSEKVDGLELMSSRKGWGYTGWTRNLWQLNEMFTMIERQPLGDWWINQNEG